MVFFYNPFWFCKVKIMSPSSLLFLVIESSLFLLLVTPAKGCPILFFFSKKHLLILLIDLQKGFFSIQGNINKQLNKKSLSDCLLSVS